jgi:hypothetical protein
MPVTKITVTTAMRARDVSRPREEHLTEVAEHEEKAGRHAPPPVPRTAPPADQPGRAIPAPPRRRRRRRS